MAQLRTRTGFDNMSDPKVIEQVSFIHQQVSTHTALFPTPMPAMVSFKDGIDDYQSAVNAALGGDRVLAGQKKIAKQAVVNMVYQLSHYVLMTANGDRQIALQSGIPLAKDGTANVITKPTDLKVVNGDQEGQLLVSVKKVKGGRAYMHQYSTDPLLNEGSWMSMTCTATKCKLEGLIPGTTYFIRVAAIGPKDQIMYSDVVSKKAA
ncbi:MAG: hypothetical protein JWR72_258 [Flavisolibacter sp.]|jgi:hypothetical protein|nr:hypothetical protein [Flavisolibacter sp.]